MDAVLRREYRTACSAVLEREKISIISLVLRGTMYAADERLSASMHKMDRVLQLSLPDAGTTPRSTASQLLFSWMYLGPIDTSLIVYYIDILQTGL